MESRINASVSVSAWVSFGMTTASRQKTAETRLQLHLVPSSFSLLPYSYNILLQQANKRNSTRTQSPRQNCCACSMLQCFLPHHPLPLLHSLFMCVGIKTTTNSRNCCHSSGGLRFGLHTGRSLRLGMENKGEKPVKQLLRIFLGQLLWQRQLQTNCCTSIEHRAAVATEPSGICQETC